MKVLLAGGFGTRLSEETGGRVKRVQDFIGDAPWKMWEK